MVWNFSLMVLCQLSKVLNCGIFWFIFHLGWSGYIGYFFGCACHGFVKGLGQFSSITVFLTIRLSGQAFGAVDDTQLGTCRAMPCLEGPEVWLPCNPQTQSRALLCTWMDRDICKRPSLIYNSLVDDLVQVNHDKIHSPLSEPPSWKTS